MIDASYGLNQSFQILGNRIANIPKNGNITYQKTIQKMEWSMEYRNLGRTGVKVSKFCLGTMMFGRTTSVEDSIPIIDYALDQGVNFVDTADVYGAGQSESIVGKALKDKRDKIVLATKAFFPMDQDDPNARGVSRRYIIKACEDSLKRLNTDYIDLYQMHRPQPDVPVDETLRALDDLIKSGKVRYIGTSMYTGWRQVEAIMIARELGLNRFVSEQSTYHLLDRTIEREVIPAAMSYDTAIITWGPLCGGLLSGKYRRGDTEAEGRWQGGQDNFKRAATETAWDVVEKLIELAEARGCTASQLALAWNAGQPGITAPIIGPRTLEQLKDNLGAVDIELTEAELAALDEVAPPRSVSMTYYDAAMHFDQGPNR
jgi:aryl-alcohol dehydrogenase-like predicted oxidoreductase